MILMDTDVCLSLLRGNNRIVESYGALTEEICVSSVTAQELFFAANRSEDPVQNRITVEKFLLTLRIVHPDMEVLQFAADVQNTLKRRSITATYQDILMYSLSKVYGARLITTNGKRYCFT
jgi:predicted nucleic acid-binding protein